MAQLVACSPSIPRTLGKPRSNLQRGIKLGMAANASDSSTGDVEARELEVQGHSCHNRFRASLGLSQNKTTTTPPHTHTYTQGNLEATNGAGIEPGGSLNARQRGRSWGRDSMNCF